MKKRQGQSSVKGQKETGSTAWAYFNVGATARCKYGVTLTIVQKYKQEVQIQIIQMFLGRRVLIQQ